MTFHKFILIASSIVYGLSILFWPGWMMVMGLASPDLMAGTEAQNAAYYHTVYLSVTYPVVVVTALGVGWWMHHKKRCGWATGAMVLPLVHLVLLVGALVIFESITDKVQI